MPPRIGYIVFLANFLSFCFNKIKGKNLKDDKIVVWEKLKG